MQDSHTTLYCTKTWKPGIICPFLILSGGLQKMLTALLNLVWNTQKSEWTICLGKMFLSIENSEDQP